MPQATSFNPKRHLIPLKGKMYLETRFRIVWFREDHPNGSISTEVISFEPVIVKATIYDGDGQVLATGHAGALDKGNAVWSGRAIEKSETAAIGRALAHAGYGTQFAGMEDAPAAQSVGSPAPTRGNGNGGKSWLDNADALAALERRLKQISPNLTPEQAAKLAGKPLASFPGLEAAVKAVAAAHEAHIAIDDPA